MHVRRLETLLSTVLLVLLGCGGSSGDKTVSGVVLDGVGQPLQNRTVLIGSGTATTNASGQFTITGVATPYDLVILEPAPTKLSTIYSQLTRLDPKVQDLAVPGSPAMSAAVGGHITGGDPLPTPAGTVTAVAWGSPEAVATSYDVPQSPYSFDVQWAGPSTTTGAVHGLQFTFDQNGTVTGYHSHGVKTGVSLDAGQPVTDADLGLTAPLTDSISWTISSPAGFEIFERDVFLTFDDHAVINVNFDGLDGGSLQIPVPSNIGAKAFLLARAVNATRTLETDAQTASLAPGTVGAALSLPTPAQVTAPPTNATGVDTSTDIVWTPLSGGIHVLFFTGAANDPGYAILSGGTHARIPDLSAHGLTLPSGHSYDLVLLGLGPIASLDAFTETGVIPQDVAGFTTVHFTGFTTR